MTWTCKTCRETNDEELDVCWKCGTGLDGSPPERRWRSELEPALEPSDRKLECLRCATPMTQVGRKKFHEGGYMADIFFGDFFVNRQAFDTYACSSCGKVEFFASGPLV